MAQQPTQDSTNLRHTPPQGAPPPQPVDTNPSMTSNVSESLGNAWNATKKGISHRLTMQGLLAQSRRSLEHYLNPKLIKAEERMSRNLLSKAIGIAFITEAKGGFIFGVKGGSGIIILRKPNAKNKGQFEPNQWTAPCAVGTGGISVGFQAGAAKVDHIIVLTTPEQVDVFLSRGQLQLKGSANATAGTTGRHASAGVNGIFGGVSLNGDVLTVRGGCNEEFYGSKVAVKDLLTGKVPMPQQNADYDALTSMLDRYSSNESMDMDDVKMDDDEKIQGESERITVYVVQGRNLPNYDINGHSDPYVKVKFGHLKNSSFRTTFVRKELNPVWNASFSEEGPNLFSRVGTIDFSVYDRDRMSKDDFMGSCTVHTLGNVQRFYASPLQWVVLHDPESKKVVKGKNGQDAAIQISIRYAPKRGKDIHRKDFMSESDPYVKVEWDAQQFQTRVLSNTKEPIWNETTFFFVNEETDKGTQMKLTAMDQDLSTDDMLGTGYLSGAAAVAAAASGKPVDVRLRQVPVEADRGLLDLQDDRFKSWGILEVGVKLVPKAEAEKGFYAALIHSFDRNQDGVIEREELAEMFAHLKIDGNLDELMQKFDENNDEKLDEQEVMAMLQDADFQGSELATHLMALHLEGNMGDDHGAHLMRGFTRETRGNMKTLKIKDRATGLIVQEHIPKYVDWALRLVYNSGLSRRVVKSRMAHMILARSSRSKGASMDLPKSAADIPGFIKQHNLDVSTLYKQVKDFKTFNDFFARGMNVDACRPLADPDDESVVVSPADCRMMVWDTILDATKVWIKGGRFTLANLLGPNSKVDLQKYEGGSFCIARLAPQDYHRWHYPIGGKVVNIEHIDGALYTVNPIAINKTVNVYTENKRAIVEIDGGKNGGCIMFAIAATMVGSYNLFKEEAADPTKDNPVPLKVGDVVKRGEVAGEWRFGASTVLLLFEPERVTWSADIARNVSADFETLLKVRSRIGQIQ